MSYHGLQQLLQCLRVISQGLMCTQQNLLLAHATDTLQACCQALLLCLVAVRNIAFVDAVN